MSKMQELVGTQVVDLYVKTMEEIATLRRRRAEINEQIREKLDEAKEMRRFVRLFDPAILDGEAKQDEPDSADE